MKYCIILLCIGFTLQSFSQKHVTKTLPVKGQTLLEIDFPFADEIEIKTWEKKEVRVEVEVTINDGEDNDVFELMTSSSANMLSIEMEKENWKKTEYRNRKCWDSEIYYVVYLPKDLELEAESISGNYDIRYSRNILSLKTISGDIDLSIERNENIDFDMKTISGEVYTDLNLEFPYGKEGLRQIVGTKARGRLGSGGNLIKLETISGNIYLRKG